MSYYLHNPGSSDAESDESDASGRYDGPERRRRATDTRKPKREIRFDAKGNPVCEVRVDFARRRRNDDTFDLLKALDVDDLGLELVVDDDTEDTGIKLYERDD